MKNNKLQLVKVASLLPLDISGGYDGNPAAGWFVSLNSSITISGQFNSFSSISEND